jgi:type IV pilus assembly protein PilB
MSTQGFAGDLLIRSGVTDAAGVERALAMQAKTPMTIGRALAALGLATEETVAGVMASALHLEQVTDGALGVDAPVAALLQPDFCRKHGALPLSLANGVLRIALIDPMNYSTLQDIGFRTGKKTVGVLVTETWLDAMLQRVYPPDAKPTSYDMLDSVSPAGEVELSNGAEYDLVDPTLLAKDTRMPPIIRLVNLILSDAAIAGASDVHIEPYETFLQVRQRVDGLLRDVLTIPHHLQDATISRFKIMSGMDISERRKPQDGRSRLRFEGNRIDLRVSTLPTQFGEKVVIRLLRADRTIQPIDQLDLSAENLRRLQAFLARPQGMILVTGPTGSGKTTTLYTALNTIKSSTNNIITLEDPIEFQLAGVSQMQINARAGVTFASGLRSVLRQDPNVILVGEIRDQETADIALQAAQTGHLLLSTLHTNDAPATITRLFDLGVQPFLVASSLLGVVAQRLVRRVCPACTTPQALTGDTVEKAGGASRLPADGQWVAGAGCAECGGSGMKGRIAIHEVLVIDDEMRDLISNRAPEHALRKAARAGGMQTLLEDGIAKAARGLTTLDEVLRAVSADGKGPAVASLAPVMQGEAVAAAPADQSPAPPLRTPRVLVVEDSTTVVAVVKYFLELEGFEVMVAENGQIGLEMALRERPDVIVTDVNMPAMGGVAMVKAIRLRDELAATHILMLTSEASIESETEGLAAGADDYLIKPVEPRRLAARVKALLARSGRRAA